MYSYFGGITLSIGLFLTGILLPGSPEEPTLRGSTQIVSVEKRADRLDPILTVAPIVFRHGDVSWLPALALKAGWTADQIPKLAEIVLRESGGCPNRRGGDMVDKNCNITGIAERTHRSDSGLLQINGVNYDPTRNKWAPLCLEMDICTQKPLMDPLTNLKAGKLLFNYWDKAAGSGWIPWDPCNRTRTCDKP